MSEEAREKAKKLAYKILEDEKKIDDSKIKQSHKRKALLVQSGKVYRDNYRISRISPDRYSSNYVISMTYDNGLFEDFDLLRPGQKTEKNIEKYIRRARIKATFSCCYNGEPANSPIEISIELYEEFDNNESMLTSGSIDSWVSYRADDAIDRIAKDECEDWNDKYTPCPHKEYNVIDKEEIIPEKKIPSDVRGNIEVIIREMKENADNADYVIELNRELDKILSRNNLTRKDIEDML